MSRHAYLQRVAYATRAGASGTDARRRQVATTSVDPPAWTGPVDQALSGASVWQTPGGVQSEIDRINSDFLVFSHEITEVVTNLPGWPSAIPADKKPLSDLFDRVWSPLIQEWQAFYAKNAGWWDNLWWNHAPEAEQFSKQLAEVRAQAERLGMHVLSPQPTKFGPSVLLDPEHNLIDDAAKKARDAADAAVGALKVALYAAVGVGATVLLVAGIQRARR